MCKQKGCRNFKESIGRPHYHACIFNYDFPDKTFWRMSKDQVTPLYRSKLLEKVWTYGYSTIGEVTFQSAGYVARYIGKKIKGSSQKAKKMQKEKYGEKIPEFALMSRRPGIGKPWLDKFFSDVYPKDHFSVNGHIQKPPRYYDSILEKKDPVLYEEIKQKRRNAHKKMTDRKIELKENWRRPGQQEQHKKLTVKSLIRSYEDE